MLATRQTRLTCYEDVSDFLPTIAVVVLPVCSLSCRPKFNEPDTHDLLETRHTILSCRDGLKVANILVAFS